MPCLDKRFLGRSLMAGLVTVALFEPRQVAAGEAAVVEFQRATYVADFAAGIARLEAMAAGDPSDVEAVFGVGGLRFFQALAGLQEGLYRHSMGDADPRSDFRGISPLIPLGLGLAGPVVLPANPRATPMTYQALRAILKRFAGDLATAEASLAKVADRPVKLPLQPLQIALDLNHDGRIDPAERLLGAFGRGGARPETTIVFDTADASWLRGYAHVLMASADMLLAFDFEKTYEAVAHNLYGSEATAFGRVMKREMQAPRPADIVQAELDAIEGKLAAMGKSPVDPTTRNELQQRLRQPAATPEAAEERRKAQNELMRLGDQERRYHAERNDLFQEKQRLMEERAGRQPGSTYASVLDLIAAVHTFDWMVVEPERLKAVRTHMLQVMAINRETWRLVRAETDDDREWLPNARQTSPFGARQLTDEVIDSWLATTALAEQVLKGEKLLPHPRFRKGVSLKRFFETAGRVDLVMMVTGHGLLPYLEDGDVVPASVWRSITRPMEQNFWMYALWFN